MNLFVKIRVDSWSAFSSISSDIYEKQDITQLIS